MSLSTCEKCGGFIPIGPDTTNCCEKCGAFVFDAPAPRLTPNEQFKSMATKARDNALADRDRFRALAADLAEALNQIRKNAESQLVCMNAMKVPDTASEWINANWNRTEAVAALAKYHAAIK